MTKKTSKKLVWLEPCFSDFGIACIKIHNPPVNALSVRMIEQLHEILLDVRNNKNIKLVYITPGLKHFSAGADLKERASMSKQKALNFLDKLNNCFDLLENLEIPTVCKMYGAALGGGAELALCCDIVIADSECKKSIKIGFPETSIGIIPGAGGTYRIYKKLNSGIAKYWILSGKQFSLKEAYDDGFVDIILENSNDLLDFLRSICNKPRSSLVAAKKTMNKCYLERSRKKQRLIELEEYKKTLDSPKRKEALEKYKKK